MPEDLQQLTAELSQLEGELARRQQGVVRIPGDPRRNISVRQNNPFNIKGPYWGAIGTGTRGFAIYRTPEEGWQAGVSQLALDHSRPMTFGQFAEKYAPAYENPTWKADVSRMLGGVPDNTPIGQIPLESLIPAVAFRESSTRAPGGDNFSRRAGKVAATVGDNRKKLESELAALEAELAQLQKSKAPTQQQLPAPAPPAEAGGSAVSGIPDWLKTAGVKGLGGLAKATQLPGVKQALQVLGLPSKYISEPVAKKIASVIPAGTVKMAPLGESGEVGPPEEFSPKEFVEKVGPTAIDFPLYGGIGKGLAFGGRMLRGSKALPKAVEAASPTGEVSKAATAAEAEAALEADLLQGVPTGETATKASSGPGREIRQHPFGMGQVFEAQHPSYTISPERGGLPLPPIPRSGRNLNPQEIAASVSRKLGRGDEAVSKTVQQIKDIQGEVTQFPWTRPLHDPFLKKILDNL